MMHDKENNSSIMGVAEKYYALIPFFYHTLNFDVVAKMLFCKNIIFKDYFSKNMQV